MVLCNQPSGRPIWQPRKPAQSQGALERFPSTLKSLFGAYCAELDHDWEEGLPWLMFAAREVTRVSAPMILCSPTR